MRNIIFLTLLVFGFISLKAQQVILKNSPFHFIDGTFKMSVEKEISENKSINLSGNIHLVEDGWNYDNSKGIAAEIQIRKYVINFNNLTYSLNGIYVSPFARASYFRMSHTGYNWFYEYDSLGNFIDWSQDYTIDASSKSVQAGILMGSQYVLNDVIAFDFYIGGGVQYSNEAGNRSHSNFGGNGLRFYTGVIPKIGFNIGVKL